MDRFLSNLLLNWIGVFVGVFAFLLGAAFLGLHHAYRRLSRYF